ncbi:MAG: hypothetical protein A2359_03995 [Candidatus Moranbacteria bacterium RIFOXYB1_FULL_43_19]|nr:MAG: hypothetical protein A2184_04625 [Candidatus Moranbacteria bacterium RIFOXYA1_FULL_44_7]OGI27816.1 MAG: hypothetical protein A2359_03995 [Candidatus Moranbacteria bacterium RIFOXYB1_FULL_43_19]OGI34025.1 MAG: hypothetical protein A2420_02685 [Candidatus Moranbacteria bacterium RIFOXYC1_FULL_44_13]OGI37735.1 MAG: hypothetical protein A2612_03180 [Candidatus Moranbacteria bacterium RIFOXYD1_FULL_44_12]
MKPRYALDKIKFATDAPTFERGIGLYESGKVKDFQENIHGYSAIVLGSKPYNVSISNRYYDQGNCDCYLGENDILCKHMVAVALQAVLGGKKISSEDKKQPSEASCSGKIGKLSKTEISSVKKLITDAMRYIKPYNGPSRVWFQYQDSLSEGCARLSAIVSSLPVSKDTAKILVGMLLRLDKKICGGVDDSDGTVGGFIEETTVVLRKYAELDPKCIEAFEKLRGEETCFGWEDPLLNISTRNRSSNTN